jgi:hypothetical protein
MLARFVALVVLATPIAVAQAQDHQLDFWVGNWVVTDTTPGAKNPPGTNTISRIYGGKVIHENFKMGTFEGQSWSAFDPKNKIWRQTWVDNSGGYIAMKILRVGKDLAIQTIPNPKAPLNASRMVFYDVTKESFNWRWEGTTDGGKTWKLNWRLHYQRKKT